MTVRTRLFAVRALGAGDLRISCFALVAAASLGCAHSEDDWRRQVRASDDLRARLAAAQAKATTASAERAEATSRLDQLEHELRDLGLDTGRLKQGAEEQARAMEERSLRRTRLEAQHKRFEAVKAALGARPGVREIALRGEALAVALADQALFDKGRDTLRPEGKVLLRSVAQALLDADLGRRPTRVITHVEAAARGTARALLASGFARASEVAEAVSGPLLGVDRARVLVGASGDAVGAAGRCEIVIDLEPEPAAPTK